MIMERDAAKGRQGRELRKELPAARTTTYASSCQTVLVHRIMNSFRVLRRRQAMASADACHKLFGGIAPVNRAGGAITFGEERQDATFDVVRAGKVVGHQHLPLQNAE